MSSGMFSPRIAKAIAFVVAATIFLGGMWLVATFVAAPFSEWVGNQIRDWPPLAIFATIVGSIATAYSIGLALHRRDQRKAAEATRFINGDAVDPRS